VTADSGVYGGRKIRQGTVVSDKMEKTVVVAVQSNIRHRLYKKTIRRVKKFMAHDEQETAKMGDVVRIVEHSPVSKRKRWAVIEVVQRAELPEVAPGSIDLELLGEVKREEPEAEETAAAPAAAVAEMEPVQMDAAPEATEAEALTHESAEVGEPEVPAREEAEVVQADAGPEATEPDPATEENAG
jgi:small subunit ribosomal protein S17